MRVLAMFIAVVVVSGCSTTHSRQSATEYEPGVMTSTEQRPHSNVAKRAPFKCRTGSVVVCESDDANAKCSCVSQRRFRFDRPPQAINLRQ